MSRLLAIGDVHGCTLQLDALFEAIRPTADDTIIFLGDLVDRGPDTKGTVDRVIAWSRSHRVICLRGNHEILMTTAKEHLAERKMWFSVGGSETLASYSRFPGRLAKLDDVPDEHWAFFDHFHAYYETDQAIFVHATLDTARPLDDQTDETLYWSKLEGPIEWPGGKTVICGHTAQKSGRVLDLGNTICLDTYAYGGGALTCLDVLSMTCWQADLRGRVLVSPLR